MHAHKAVYRSREFGLRAIAGASPRKLYDVIVACGIRVVMAETIKNGLKWFFGRPWPETWRNNNSSWIGNHDYALQWLHGGGEFRSFPSGHTTATFAVLSIVVDLLSALARAVM